MYEEARHEPLTEAEWNPELAHAAIDRIVRDTQTHFDAQKLWPIHPLDKFSVEQTEPFRMLYFGAAGVIWALDYLRGAGTTAIQRDYKNTLIELAAKNRADMQLHAPHTYSYLMGDVGIQLVQWRLTPSGVLADQIFQAVEANVANPARELMWGAPGTMLAALTMLASTGESRWNDVYLQSVEQLLSEWERNAKHYCHVWTQDLYGRSSIYLGAVHGFAANIFSIIKGRKYLDSRTLALVESRARETVARSAQADEVYANWPAELGGTSKLVQHCHGAPGMITCLADLPSGPDEEFDRLLKKAGELIWLAGPLTKGPNLCHGTAGNGYAFLKLHRRTGEAKWRDRARAFAMHAIEQSERHAKNFGQRRYSLWTGDLGLAVYLWDCINGQAQFPTMDVF
jgi:lantibiotic modifying enzyme